MRFLDRLHLAHVLNGIVICSSTCIELVPVANRQKCQPRPGSQQLTPEAEALITEPYIIRLTTLDAAFASWRSEIAKLACG